MSGVYGARTVPKVSVIVPVYDPGEKLSACVESLLAQTLPTAETELIFVDDGSTDDSPARLDALAAEHGNVVVEHIPSSGWPGRPRNRGLELATGDYVYFVDDDDWLDPQALERLHEMAVLDDADIVVGKVVGHGRSSAPLLFRENLHGVRFEDGPALLLKLLTPHKLFRSALLAEPDLRFPEGRRRLEDHMFVVEAYFRAARISILADHPCYHWVFHDPAENASHQRIGEDYFDAVRDVLDLVERHTEPGALRDQIEVHWYANKMLKRVGGPGFARRAPRRRLELFEAIRRLALERWDDGIHAWLPLLGRVRSRLLREGSLDGLVALSRMEQDVAARVEPVRVHAPGPHATLQVRARLEGGALAAFVRRGDRILWDAPEELRGALTDDDLDVTAELRRSNVDIHLHGGHEGELRYVLPGTTRVALDEEAEPGRVVPVLTATATIAPTIAAGGAPLPAGRWTVHASADVAGISRAEEVAAGRRPLVLTSVPPGRIVRGVHPPPPASFKRRLRTRAPWLARAVRRARALRGAAGRR
jgi:glycosyltransferase involved in cell wall biosynthesis